MNGYQVLKVTIPGVNSGVNLLELFFLLLFHGPWTISDINDISSHRAPPTCSAMPFRSRHILSSDAIWAPRKAGRTSLVPRTMECWKGQTNQWDVPTKLCYWTLVAMSWFLKRKASHLLFLISKGRKKLTIIILYPDDSWSGLLLSYYRATKTTFQKESGTAYHWPLVNSACCWAGPLVGHIPYPGQVLANPLQRKVANQRGTHRERKRCHQSSWFPASEGACNRVR